MPHAIQASDPVPADTTIEITLVLRRRGELRDPAAAAPISVVTLAADYGADPVDVDLVTATVTALGARVLSVHAAARLVRVEGTAAALSRMFGTSLELVTSQDPTAGAVTHRVRSRPATPQCSSAGSTAFPRAPTAPATRSPSSSWVAGSPRPTSTPTSPG